MPLSLPIGLLVGCAHRDPVRRHVRRRGIALLVTLADGGSLQTLGMVAGVILCLHLLEAAVLTPKIVGHRVGLSESGALLAVVAGGKLLGFVGVVLAVPIAATIAVLVRYAVTLLRAHRVLRPRVRCRRRDHAGDGADHAGRAARARRSSPRPPSRITPGAPTPTRPACRTIRRPARSRPRSTTTGRSRPTRWRRSRSARPGSRRPIVLRDDGRPMPDPDDAIGHGRRSCPGPILPLASSSRWQLLVVRARDAREHLARDAPGSSGSTRRRALRDQLDRLRRRTRRSCTQASH